MHGLLAFHTAVPLQINHTYNPTFDTPRRPCKSATTASNNVSTFPHSFATPAMSGQNGSAHSNDTLHDHVSRFGPKPAILLTNDDGIHPEKASILDLARHFIASGLNVVVCAPGKNNSACGQKITLFQSLTMRRHPDYEKRYSAIDAPTPTHPLGTLNVFSIDEGSPADCVIASIEPRTGLLARLGVWPQLVVSGVNYGQNLGSDVIYSGTFAAARQAGMYGIPAIASSIDLYNVDPSCYAHRQSCQRAVSATVQLALAALDILPPAPQDLGRLHPSNALGKQQRARDCSLPMDDRIAHAFGRGDLVFNVNIPVQWNGSFQPTRLDCVMYRNVIDIEHIPTGIPGDKNEKIEVNFQGGGGQFLHAPGSDLVALRENAASVSPVCVWPISHPLALPEALFEDSLKAGVSWLPNKSKVFVTDQV